MCVSTFTDAAYIQAQWLGWAWAMAMVVKIATFIALLYLLCGHNALNLTVTTVYLLAAVIFMFLEALMANQFAIQ